ncbi:MAG TPA: hypothetical protein VFA12_01945 [Stellaceae bacterium]|nr:hypothetical protein [Stellaceae bacterium]
MDLDALKEAAIEATTRALRQKFDIPPDEDSEEWEEEYRRQFAALKQRHGDVKLAPARPAPAATEAKWPELTGTPEQLRWAATIRAERLREIPNEAMRTWLGRTWTRAKVWVDTRDVPTPVLLQRLQPQYAEYRKQAAAQAQARAAEEQAKAAALAAHQQRLREAGITPEGLVELIDASERADPAPLQAKIADITVEHRHLRVFETADPNVLLVKEKHGPLNSEYGIESDDGLIADLKLFAQTPG